MLNPCTNILLDMSRQQLTNNIHTIGIVFPRSVCVYRTHVVWAKSTPTYVPKIVPHSLSLSAMIHTQSQNAGLARIKQLSNVRKSFPFPRDELCGVECVFSSPEKPPNKINQFSDQTRPGKCMRARVCVCVFTYIIIYCSASSHAHVLFCILCTTSIPKGVGAKVAKTWTTE